MPDPRTGAIFGTTQTPDGAPLPGVTVTATGPSTQTNVTTPQGQFRFRRLPVGTYALTAELEGFRTIRREGLEVRRGRTLSLLLTLEVAPPTS